MDTTPHRKQHRLLFISLGIVLAILVTIATILFLKASNKPAEQQTPIVSLKTPTITPKLITRGFESPTGIATTKGDKRLFVIERAGNVRVVDSGKLTSTPFLNIQDKVLANGEMGLLGLAFHPEYKENGYFFVNYIDKAQNTVIARYHTSSGVVDMASEKIVFTLKQPYTNHNGGDLAFGPDGYLYVSLGDGGSAGDPENRAQDKNSYLGKILRLDINSNEPYTIPTSNPFVGQDGVKQEIWAYGLRNPWRISFDKATNDLYVADVGQGNLEEVNVQKSDSKGGENYGWRCYEGNQPHKPDGCGDATDYVAPVTEYNHDEDRCSITGGYVYRGKSYMALTGKYFYADFCSGQLFYASNKDGKWAQTLAAKTTYSISAFGQDSDGELYFTDFKDGGLYKIEDSAN